MRRILAATLAAALLLAACTSDEEIEANSPPIVEPEPEPQPEPAPEPEPEPAPEPEPEPADLRPRSFVTGEPVDEEVMERPLLLVKIENSPQSRPQTGLDAADIVFEQRVEAAVTRFMALFHSQLPESVGPTRSARPVDAEMVAGFGRSGFVYSGARPEVQGMLAGTPAVRIAEGGPGFHRISERRAPHNLYLRLQPALDAVIERDAEVLDSIGWVFAEEPPRGEERCPPDAADCEDPGHVLDVAMTTAFVTNWTYDEDEGVYLRSQNGEPFLAADGSQIRAANVLVLGARFYTGGSGYPETSVLTEGSRGIALRDGNRYEVTWTKPTPADHIELLDARGLPFALTPGPTWVLFPSESNLPAPLSPPDEDVDPDGGG